MSSGPCVTSRTTEREAKEIRLLSPTGCVGLFPSIFETNQKPTVFQLELRSCLIFADGGDDGPCDKLSDYGHIHNVRLDAFLFFSNPPTDVRSSIVAAEMANFSPGS